MPAPTTAEVIVSIEPRRVLLARGHAMNPAAASARSIDAFERAFGNALHLAVSQVAEDFGYRALVVIPSQTDARMLDEATARAGASPVKLPDLVALLTSAYLLVETSVTDSGWAVRSPFGDAEGEVLPPAASAFGPVLRGLHPVSFAQAWCMHCSEPLTIVRSENGTELGWSDADSSMLCPSPEGLTDAQGWHFPR